LLAALLLLVAVNYTPVNPYHQQWLAGFRPGRMRDVLDVAALLAALWPLALIAVLLAHLRRRALPR
jgi:hypothetical protein